MIFDTNKTMFGPVILQCTRYSHTRHLFYPFHAQRPHLRTDKKSLETLTKYQAQATHCWV